MIINRAVTSAGGPSMSVYIHIYIYDAEDGVVVAVAEVIVAVVVW